ncbi:MAG: hypothetical protein Aurels2KO_00230 [Aureliella sp.]
MQRSLIATLVSCLAAAANAKTAVVTFYGYDDCIEISNADTRVVLCPAAGGRVLYYGTHQENLLYLPPGDEGWKWDGSSTRGRMTAGRFDIGPEKMVPKRLMLWQGEWKAETTGELAAIMTSQFDESTGVVLRREFALAASGTTLRCTQTIENKTDSAVEYCHWSRTFLRGKGTCFVPLSRFSKFPNHYVRYDDAVSINYRPEDDHIQRTEDCLVITDRPKNPKLGFDSREGWLAYAIPNSKLFVKRFPVYPRRAYNEVAGLTISVWYPDDAMVELEPIGPAERLELAQSASFTETWNFLDADSSLQSPTEIAAAVGALSKAE